MKKQSRLNKIINSIGIHKGSDIDEPVIVFMEGIKDSWITEKTKQDVKQALYQALLEEVIGEDEIQGPKGLLSWMVYRNHLRAELRQKLSEFCGVEEGKK